MVQIDFKRFQLREESHPVTLLGVDRWTSGTGNWCSVIRHPVS